MASEQDILGRVRTALHHEPRVGTKCRLDDLALDADGVLTIVGEAADVAVKRLALERAAALPEVAAIVDRLHVAPATPMGDSEIRAHLRDFYTHEPAFAGFAVRQMRTETRSGEPVFETVTGDPTNADGLIDIEVRRGVVILNGRTTGLVSKRLAGAMAWWVPGVRDVVNGLEVDPPEEDAPIRIEEAVRIVLERDPLVDASQIRVGVRHRIVRLTGAVGSEELKQMAGRDAWCVFGVDDVVNEITVVS
jgi:osmotically-inducible protein OsmY